MFIESIEKRQFGGEILRFFTGLTGRNLKSKVNSFNAGSSNAVSSPQERGRTREEQIEIVYNVLKSNGIIFVEDKKLNLEERIGLAALDKTNILDPLKKKWINIGLSRI